MSGGTTAPDVVVFGYDELVLDTVDVVRRGGGRIAAVVLPCTRQRDARVQRVRARLEAAGTRILVQPPRSATDPFVEALMALAPDLILVWSYPMILPQAVLDVPRLGALNVHMGRLPEQRGAHALQWAVAQGQEETAVTLHYMDAGVDTGPLLAQARVPIGPDDDIADVLRTARRAGVALLTQGWPHYSARRLPARAQDERRAGHAAPRTHADDRIDWSDGADGVRDLVRATAAPFPAAHTTWRGRALGVRRCTVLTTAADGPPGTLCAVTDAGIDVATGNGVLRITALELEAAPLTPAGFAAAGARAGEKLV